MGAWGFSLFENDSSCDVRDYFLRTTRENSEKSVYDVMDIVQKQYAEQMEDEQVVFALASLAITFTILTPALYDKAVKAVNRAYWNLHIWDEPDKRRAFLNGFKAYLSVSVADR